MLLLILCALAALNALLMMYILLALVRGMATGASVITSLAKLEAAPRKVPPSAPPRRAQPASSSALALRGDTKPRPASKPAEDIIVLPEWMSGVWKCTGVVPGCDPNAYMAAVGVPYLMRKLAKAANYGVGVQQIKWTQDKVANVLVHNVQVRSPVKNADFESRLHLNGAESKMETPDGNQLTVSIVRVEEGTVHMTAQSPKQNGGKPQQMRIWKLAEGKCAMELSAQGSAMAREFTLQA